MSFEGVSSDLFIRDPLTKEAARVREDSLQVIGAFFSIQEKFTGNNTVGQQFLLAHTPVLTNVLVEITTDGITWTGFSSFIVGGQTITTTAAIPASPTNNVRVTYFIAKINTAAVVTSPSLDQQVAQLSQIEINTSDLSPNVAFEVGQLSTIISELQGLSITIGEVNINTDQLEDLTRQFQASNAEGLTNVILATVEGFTNVYLLLGQEVSQLSQVEINQNDQTTLLAQEVEQLSQIITNTGVAEIDLTPILSQEVAQLSTIITNTGVAQIDVRPLLVQEITQLSTLELYGSQQVAQLSNLTVDVVLDDPAIFQQVTQLSNLNVAVALEVQQLTTIQLYGSQEVSQLSTIITNTATPTADPRPLLAQEVTQLSNLNTAVVVEITQLTTIQLYGSQEVVQLSQIISNTAAPNIDTRPLMVQQVTQLSTLELYDYQEVGQLTTVLLYESQQVSQLSQIVSNTSGESGVIPLLAQEVTQLSTKIVQENQMIAQLTTLELYSSQQVGQLSNTYTILNGISIVDGRVLISSQPPDAPPATVSVIRSAQSTMAGTADDVYTITNGKKLTILRLRGGAGVGGTGAKIEIYYDPAGTGAGMTLIDAGYASGSNFIFDESSSQTYTGNGTRAIRMRRTRFGAGTLEIYGRWDGYEL